MATGVSSTPTMAQLQSVQKAMAIPTVGAAVGQVGALYTKVKGAHSLLEWALSTAEAGVVLAATTAPPYVSHSLAVGDAKVAAAIDSLEQRVPIVCEQPKVIVETTKQAVMSRISPHVNKMATGVSSTPTMAQLQSVQKAMAIPTVGAAVGQVGALYTKVKGAHSLLEWALSTAEAGVVLAATTAAPYVSHPLAVGDAKVAAAIDSLEQRVPIVCEQPKVIVETTKQAVMSRISPHVNKVYGVRANAEQRVKSLKELSWVKANALLSTAYGQKAVHNIDSGASYAMQLLDHYLPPVGAPEEVSTEVTPLNKDPALHTVQTVGRLSSVAARRVWANLAYKINELRNSGIELDVRRYITALLAALHLAKVTSQEQQTETEEEEKKAKTNGTHPAPTSPIPPTSTIPPNTQESSPKTTKKVKSTPESKSVTNSNTE